MESRLDAAAEPSHVLSQFAPTRLSQGSQGQPLNLTGSSASTSRHINLPRTAFVPRLAFPSSTTSSLFQPLPFSENARSEGICDLTWIHKRGWCGHLARVHLLFIRRGLCASRYNILDKLDSQLVSLFRCRLHQCLLQANFLPYQQTT